MTRSATKNLDAQDQNRLRTATHASSEQHKQKRAEQNQAKYRERGFVHVDYKSGAFHEGLKRDPPKCKTCGKPRKGHRRGACAETPVTPHPSTSDN